MFPAFARFGGQLTDCLILSMHPEDIGEAWALAYERARYQGADGWGSHLLRTRLRTLPVQMEHTAID
jgi:hypothetical protein